MSISYCPACGAPVNGGDIFCGSCGSRLPDVPAGTPEPNGWVAQTSRKINRMVGEDGHMDLNLRDVFSSVFVRHSKEEAELLFISGTSRTTPAEADIQTSWPKPWLFSRVFLVLAAVYAGLYGMSTFFENTIVIPGLIVMGAFAVPFSLLVFFWEANAPRNISIFEVVRLFFIGGVASMAASLFLFSIFPVVELNLQGAVMVGVIEEAGKLLIAAYFIRRLNVKYILNGLLIGAAIGAGFSAFESAGYAFTQGAVFGEGAMLSNIADRGWMSIGGHTTWAAISAGALVYVKGRGELSSNHFMDTRFLKLFVIPVLLHTAWNSPLFVQQESRLLYMLLIFIAWVFVFSLMNAGLKQISRMNRETPPPLPESS
ncbi:PrsW family glutamic-type intramembrane protease [Alkalicoccus urumqiensis]|uniref:PrsW family intramembrane metalloprotease n=1 Tax=Alkalicoccus urumqiensis TaxID=1548213 RepID=A0A2P6MHY2_ALKUR|nr:PrsW family glutamic-type intramembrane protease [Alkalicoccus urumqiensis]PRO65870.1 PrsW family intramembrane metalloprotease [Alkalicoccus urumqiensis]